MNSIFEHEQKPDLSMAINIASISAARFLLCENKKLKWII